MDVISQVLQDSTGCLRSAGMFYLDMPYLFGSHVKWEAGLTGWRSSRLRKSRLFKERLRPLASSRRLSTYSFKSNTPHTAILVCHARPS